MTESHVKITAANIHTKHGRGTLRVTLEDGSEQNTISWYAHELTFTPLDAIGRMVEELRQLHHQRDRADFSPEQAHAARAELTQG